MTPMGRSRAAGEEERTAERTAVVARMVDGPRCPAALEARDERVGPDKTWGGRQR